MHQLCDSKHALLNRPLQTKDSLVLGGGSSFLYATRPLPGSRPRDREKERKGEGQRLRWGHVRKDLRLLERLLASLPRKYRYEMSDLPPSPLTKGNGGAASTPPLMGQRGASTAKMLYHANLRTSLARSFYRCGPGTRRPGAKSAMQSLSASFLLVISRTSFLFLSLSPSHFRRTPTGGKHPTTPGYLVAVVEHTYLPLSLTGDVVRYLHIVLCAVR